MALKRSTPLDDPPSASSDDDETEDEQEQEIITQKTIQESSSSSEEEEEEDEDEDEDEEEESQEEPIDSMKIPLENPKSQNPGSKPVESSSEEEEEEESEEETPTLEKTSIEKPQTLTSKSSSIYDLDSDIKSPTASDFAIKPSKKISTSETSEKTPTSKRPFSESDLKDKKKIKVSNGEADDEKKSVVKRVWSDEDEIMLLQGFIDYQSKKGRSPLSDMDGFYQFTMDSLPGNASKSQLYEKVRRLKKKFRVNSEKVSGNGEDPVFAKPHECKLFELSKKIWGIGGCESVSAAAGGSKSSNAKSRIRHIKVKPKIEVKEVVEDDEVMEKMVDFEDLYPNWNAGLNSEVSTTLKFPSGVVNLIKENLSLIGEGKAKEMDEKWGALFEDEAVLQKRRIALLGSLADLEATS